ncbi:glycosyltransferase [Geodermatophilus sp. SYSU D00758]
MRVLVAALPAFGHLYPLMPLAAALRAAGEDVVLATADPVAAPLRAAGWRVEEVPCDVAGGRRELIRTRPELAELPPAERWRLGNALFAELLPATTAPRLLDVVARLRPDLVIYEDADLGAAVAGAVTAVPVVRHGLGPLPGAVQERLADTLRENWPVPGTAPPEGPAVLGIRYLDTYPPALRTGPAELPIPAIPMRPVPWSDPEVPMPAWVLASRSRPLVYLTLGTVPFVALPVLREAARGLAALDVDVLVATGPEGDPGALRPLPEHVQVTRFLPQAAVLEHVGLVVHHGGSGTTLACLARGLPQLVLPQALPDQALNAANVHAAGAGLALPPHEVTADTVADRARTLLREPRYSERAHRVREDVDRMPSPAETVPALRALASCS